MGLNYQYGYLLPEYEFVSYLTTETIKSAELSFHKVTNGDKIWQRILGYPSIGAALHLSTLGNPELYGNAASLSTFIGFYFLKRDRVNILFRIGPGLTYVTKHFDLQNNYKNVAVGSNVNFYFNSSLETNIRVFKETYLKFGTSFSHISNANLQEPNMGLNFWNFYVGSDFLLGNKVNNEKREIPSYNPKNVFSATYSASLKHTRSFESYK